MTTYFNSGVMKLEKRVRDAEARISNLAQVQEGIDVLRNQMSSMREKLGELQKEAAAKDEIVKKAKRLTNDAVLEFGMEKSDLDSKKDLVQRLHGRIREVEASHELVVTCRGLKGKLESAREEAARAKREKSDELEQAVRAAKKA